MQGIRNNLSISTMSEANQSVATWKSVVERGEMSILRVRALKKFGMNDVDGHSYRSLAMASTHAVWRHRLGRSARPPPNAEHFIAISTYLFSISPQAPAENQFQFRIAKN